MLIAFLCASQLFTLAGCWYTVSRVRALQRRLGVIDQRLRRVERLAEAMDLLKSGKRLWS